MGSKDEGPWKHGLSSFCPFIFRKENLVRKYYYEGPVMEFNKCLSERWFGETYAATEAKAKSNLAYQFKQNNNRMATAKITLPGSLQIVW